MCYGRFVVCSNSQHLAAVSIMQHNQKILLLQFVTFIIAGYQLKTGASPYDRFRLLPVFFLGSAELASGLSGL